MKKRSFELMTDEKFEAFRRCLRIGRFIQSIALLLLAIYFLAQLANL